MFPLSIKYNRDAIPLLPTPPQFSDRAVEGLGRRERELGIRFPDAVREWYSLEGAVDLLRQFSNTDHPVPIEKLGEPLPNWRRAGPRDFLAQGLVVFIRENQFVCNWAFRLDESPDPEVLVKIDTALEDEWLRCADTFSTFVYCQVWDYRQGGTQVSAQEVALDAADLQFLSATFPKRPSTHGWPGKTNYRFEAENGHILLWDGENRGADWFISAKTPASLRAILSRIWHCGNLAETLYDITPEAADVLRDLRGARSGGR